NELPVGRFVVNLCNDRLHFAVGLAAALMRDQVNLLTSDRSPERLRSLQDQYPDVYSLSDDPTVRSPLRHHHHRSAQPPRPFRHRPENPQIAAERVAAIVFTSGSTGVPTAHEKPWGALVERSVDAAACFDITQSEPVTIVGMVPPQHMYGFET